MVNGGIPSTGIFLRVAHRFRQRNIEWLAACQIAGWGAVLLRDGDTFGSSPTYVQLAEMGTEDHWGYFMLFAGVGRLLGLVVNGARQDVTPWIRAVGAIFGFFIFGIISMGVITAWYNGSAPSTGFAIYPPAMVAELVALYYSLKDAKAYRDGRKLTT